LWDYYSLGALILETVMTNDYFFRVDSEADLKKSAIDHLRKSHSDTHLKRLMEGTIFASDDKHMLRLDDI